MQERRPGPGRIRRFAAKAAAAGRAIVGMRETRPTSEAEEADKDLEEAEDLEEGNEHPDEQ